MDESFEFDGRSLDFKNYQAISPHGRFTLTRKECMVMKYLIQRAGQVVSRDQLLNEVWGYNAAVTTHTLETHVYRLRQKIEEDPSNAKILLTKPGGYLLHVSGGI